MIMVFHFRGMHIALTYNTSNTFGINFWINTDCEAGLVIHIPVHLLKSESVDKLADFVHFTHAWFDFTQAKCQDNQNL